MRTLMTVSQVHGMSNTDRWHNTKHSRTQTVGCHSYGVAQLARMLAPDDLTDREMVELLTLALDHDIHEPVYGDIPYPAREAMKVAGIDVDRLCMEAFWGKQGVPEDLVSPRVKAIVEVADKLDAALYSKAWIPWKYEDIARQTTEAALRILDNVGMSKVLSALGEPIPVRNLVPTPAGMTA